jgi:hypothetical protein
MSDKLRPRLLRLTLLDPDTGEERDLTEAVGAVTLRSGDEMTITWHVKWPADE